MFLHSRCVRRKRFLFLLEEVMANIREAIELSLETMDVEERKLRLSKEIRTTSLDVNVG